MKVGLKELQDLTRQLYLKLEYPASQIETIGEVLSYAHRRGNFQSLIQEVGVGTPHFAAQHEIMVEKETALSYLINGGGNIGICALYLATDLLVEKAGKTSGFAIGGIHNSSAPGTGPAGYYAERVARRGFISMIFCGSSKIVAPSGSSERAFGTNPIAIGIPTSGAPIVLDMATSIMPAFKVAEALIRGEELPPNVGYDHTGGVTQDPREVLKSGALMTFDRGPKSSGLALIVELLANALSGGCLPGDPGSSNWGNLAFAIDPDLLIGRESFFKNVDRTIAYIKGLNPADPPAISVCPVSYLSSDPNRRLPHKSWRSMSSYSGLIGNGCLRRFRKLQCAWCSPLTLPLAAY
ncbi:MAG: Ldh family oxidoreductase [Verrucomicrobia bacterium]|nr:Ldh family oxidoreductase [Verrucomicrobiota bacterium]MBV8482480.1 Ldh family oxidoreductase [Verrucomicrobiota bacterium]